MPEGVDLAVVGLGYVGLPLARRACAAGLRTVGYDIDAAVVGELTAGRSPVPGVTGEDIAMMAAAGFTARTDLAVLGRADTVVICVPTGLRADRTPDLGPVRSAAAAVGSRLRPGVLVVLESTTYPGTTRDLVRPILEQASGLTAGEDFYLAFAPERIDPGNHRFGIVNTPKIVGGHTPLCAKHGAVFYGRVVDTVVVARGTREAELAKLLENTYRFVNIALVNELARYCATVDIDVWDVLHCAATKPFGFAPFTPGPGVGGHCIPIDPLYLSNQAAADGFAFTLIDAAARINDSMPAHVLTRALALLDERGIAPTAAQVLLLGVTYKPDVPDTRESPAVALAEGLLAAGAQVAYHDPHVAEFALRDRHLTRVADLAAAMRHADLTILLQDHAEYDPVVLSTVPTLLLDTRGKVPGKHVEHF